MALNSNVKMMNSNLIGNSVNQLDGYVFSCQTCLTFEMYNTLVLNNVGIMDIGLCPQIAMHDCRFENNRASKNILNIATGTDVAFHNVSFHDNQASSPIITSILNIIGSIGSTVTCQDMIFNNNNAANTLAVSFTNATLDNVIFTNNIEPNNFTGPNLPGWDGGNGGAQFVSYFFFVLESLLLLLASCHFCKISRNDRSDIHSLPFFGYINSR
jgi:hypothetical protein